jgi:hypothetical protein
MTTIVTTPCVSRQISKESNSESSPSSEFSSEPLPLCHLISLGRKIVSASPSEIMVTLTSFIDTKDDMAYQITGSNTLEIIQYSSELFNKIRVVIRTERTKSFDDMCIELKVDNDKKELEEHEHVISFYGKRSHINIEEFIFSFFRLFDNVPTLIRGNGCVFEDDSIETFVNSYMSSTSCKTPSDVVMDLFERNVIQFKAPYKILADDEEWIYHMEIIANILKTYKLEHEKKNIVKYLFSYPLQRNGICDDNYYILWSFIADLGITLRDILSKKTGVACYSRLVCDSNYYSSIIKNRLNIKKIE